MSTIFIADDFLPDPVYGPNGLIDVALTTTQMGLSCVVLCSFLMALIALCGFRLKEAAGWILRAFGLAVAAFVVLPYFCPSVERGVILTPDQVSAMSEVAINWGVIGCIALTAVMFLVLSYVLKRYKHLQKKRETARVAATEAERKRRMKIAQRNYREVEGINFALGQGFVTKEQMETLEPAVLQALIDGDNPLSLELANALEQLAEYDRLEGQLNWRDRARHKKLKEAVREIRVVPELVRLKALGPATDSIIANARDQMKLVRELTEG